LTFSAPSPETPAARRAPADYRHRGGDQRVWRSSPSRFTPSGAARPAGPLRCVGGPFTLQGSRRAGRDRRRYEGTAVPRLFRLYQLPRYLPDHAGANVRRAGRAPRQADPGLFITIDPERDTAQSLKDYLPRFDPRIIRSVGRRRGDRQGRKGLSRLCAQRAAGKRRLWHGPFSIVYLMTQRASS